MTQFTQLRNYVQLNLICCSSRLECALSRVRSGGFDSLEQLAAKVCSILDRLELRDSADSLTSCPLTAIHPFLAIVPGEKSPLATGVLCSEGCQFRLQLLGGKGRGVVPRALLEPVRTLTLPLPRNSPYTEGEEGEDAGSAPPYI